MANTSKAIEAITESRPPATDPFTYLTIIGEYADSHLLPTLNEILQDPNLTQVIGWDLVRILLPIPGSEACLETIARLGNPREVILAVLGVLATLGPSEASGSDQEQEEEEGEDGDVIGDAQQARTESKTKGVVDDAKETPEKFVTLLGILAILHRRLKVKRPSRFLASTLQTVLRAYNPVHNQMTAAVMNLVQSLSGRRRPPLPTRKSSLSMSGLLDPDRDGDASKNAPDPEAVEHDTLDPSEDEIQRRLLLSFVSCILEAYVNANSMSWSARLLEFYNPDKIVPHRQTALQAFREDDELLGRDAVAGQLVALTRDLGLSTCSNAFLQDVTHGKIQQDPLAGTDDGVAKPEDIPLSSGGSVCLLAYWVFSNTVFQADQPKPEISVFPQHLALLELFLADDAQGHIVSNPGTIDAVVALGLWLVHNGRILPRPAEQPSRRPSSAEEEGTATTYMNYLLLLTLNAVYHPSLQVRNAATTLAGRILHADPDVNDRLKILYDLLENCMFGTLKACAVAWLREELIAAASSSAPSDSTSSNPFHSADALDALQYAVFPNLESLRDMDSAALLEWWAQNSPFILQGVNFALFLFHDKGAYARAVPQGMAAAVEMRYVEPLAAVAKLLETPARKEGAAPSAPHADAKTSLVLDVEVLQNRLAELGLTATFRNLAVSTTEEGVGA